MIDLLSIEIILFIYVFVGSTSIGYLFIRSGWPQIRKFSIEKKLKLSIILGAVFNLGVLAISFFLVTTKITNLKNALMITLVIAFALELLFLTFKRNFLGQKSTTKILLPTDFIFSQQIKKHLAIKVEKMRKSKTKTSGEKIKKEKKNSKK